MEVIYEVEGTKKKVICPDLRDKYGHPDFLAIREHFRSQGMNHKGRIQIAA